MVLKLICLTLYHIINRLKILIKLIELFYLNHRMRIYKQFKIIKHLMKLNMNLLIFLLVQVALLKKYNLLKKFNNSYINLYTKHNFILMVKKNFL